MDINLTFFGEMITFGVLIFVTMKFIWPPITLAMKARQEKIAEGLAQGERGRRDLEIARETSLAMIRDANQKAREAGERANQEVVKTIEVGKEKSRRESEKILQLAHHNLEREKAFAHQEIQNEALELAVILANKILLAKVDTASDKRIFAEFIKDIENA